MRFLKHKMRTGGVSSKEAMGRVGSKHRLFHNSRFSRICPFISRICLVSAKQGQKATRSLQKRGYWEDPKPFCFQNPNLALAKTTGMACVLEIVTFASICSNAPPFTFPTSYLAVFGEVGEGQAWEVKCPRAGMDLLHLCDWLRPTQVLESPRLFRPGT